MNNGHQLLNVVSQNLLACPDQLCQDRLSICVIGIIGVQDQLVWIPQQLVWIP